MTKSSIIRVAKWLSIAAALCLAPAALAQSRDRDRDHHHGWDRWRPPGRVAAPEFDPAAAGAVGALLAGGGLLLASKRKR